MTLGWSLLQERKKVPERKTYDDNKRVIAFVSRSLNTAVMGTQESVV